MLAFQPERMRSITCPAFRAENPSLPWPARVAAGPVRLGRGVALPDHPHWTARILRAHDRAPSSARMSAQDARCAGIPARSMR